VTGREYIGVGKWEGRLGGSKGKRAPPTDEELFWDCERNQLHGWGEDCKKRRGLTSSHQGRRGDFKRLNCAKDAAGRKKKTPEKRGKPKNERASLDKLRSDRESLEKKAGDATGRETETKTYKGKARKGRIAKASK